jgi:hypothetical protein
MNIQNTLYLLEQNFDKLRLITVADWLARPTLAGLVAGGLLPNPSPNLRKTLYGTLVQ